MSAFQVSDRHIGAIIDKLASVTRGGSILLGDGSTADLGTASGRNALGAMLIRENVASVDYRYPTPPVDGLPADTGEGYRHRSRFPLSDAEILRAVECYRYQSCEHPGWERSAANRITAELERELIRRLLETIPAYVRAPWSIDETETHSCEVES